MNDIDYEMYNIIVQYGVIKDIIGLGSGNLNLRTLTIRYFNNNIDKFNYKNVYDILTFNNRNKASFDLIHTKYRKYIKYRLAIDKTLIVYWYDWMVDTQGGSNSILYRVNKRTLDNYNIKPTEYDGCIRYRPKPLNYREHHSVSPIILLKKHLNTKSYTLIGKEYKYKYNDYILPRRYKCNKCSGNITSYGLCILCDKDKIEASKQLRRKVIIDNYIDDGSIITCVCKTCNKDIAFTYTSTNLIKCIDCDKKNLYNNVTSKYMSKKDEIDLLKVFDNMEGKFNGSEEGSKNKELTYNFDYKYLQ